MVTNHRQEGTPERRALILTWARRAFFGAIAFVLVVWVCVRLVLPIFLTDEVLHEKIEAALYENTGFRLEIAGEAKLIFSPLPGVQLNGVTVLPADRADKRPILQASRVSAMVDIVSTLLGSPSLSKVYLTDAQLRFSSNASGHNNLEPQPPVKPVAADANEPPAADAQQENAAPSAPQQAQDPAYMNNFPVKEIVFTNSSLEVFEDGELTILLQNANGNVRWPGMNERLSLNITTDYRGKTLTVRGGSSEAGKLVQGGLGQLAFTVRSDFLNADFDGIGNLGNPAYLDGNFKLQSEALPDLFEWLGDPVHASVPIRSIEVTSKLKTSGSTLTLDGLQLTVDNVPASGAIEIGLPPGGTPSLAGTLAFETFDIYGFLSTFTPIPVGPGGEGKKVDTAFLRRLKLDLRLSADKASYGPFNLTGMAASARIEDRFASFDIAASRYANSSVTARLTLDERNLPQRTGSLRLDTGKIDLGVVAKALNLEGPLPEAKGNISAELSANLPFWAASASDISGMMEIKTGPGVLQNFDARTFRTKAAREDFFNISDVSDGSMAFQSLNLNAQIKNGLVELTTAETTGQYNNLSLKGIIPYRNQSLALTGTLSSTSDAPDNVYFFAGGAWPDIVITPVSAMVRPAGSKSKTAEDGN
ncbi:hypothetical protein NHF56_12715 [Rhizobium sp. L1K21]|nr:hypothetical protein [Rhizobium sp. L1K21]